MLKMYVLLTDYDANMKLGIYNKEFWIYTSRTDWVKFNTEPNNFELAKSKFKKLCEQHKIDEMRTNNTLNIG